MMNDGNLAMPDANNMTVRTWLSSCGDRSLDLTGAVQNLYRLYQNNHSDLTVRLFSNVSIINLNCTSGAENYFEQLLTFSQAVSIRTQVLFASVYSDYLNANDYQLSGLTINRGTYFTLSSITVNNSALSDVCSSADAAHDALCRTNLTQPLCTFQSNRWNFRCSSLGMDVTSLETAQMATGLTTWQLALVCSLSIAFVLFLLVLAGCLYRRYTRTKKIALSRINLYDDPNFLQKAGIPQSDVFQRAVAIVQPNATNHTATSWVHNETVNDAARRNKPPTHGKPLKLDQQRTLNDRANAQLPTSSLTTTQNPIVSSNGIPESPKLKTIPVSRSASERVINEFKPRTDASDSSSLNQSNLNDSRTPLTGQMTNEPLPEENLRDEDAWMSILDVVNAELAMLEKQEQIRLPM